MSRMKESITTIAAVQAAPVFLDREATVEKACGLIEEAGKQGARLVLFPEAFIPTYPDWIWSAPPGDGIGGEAYSHLLDSSVAVPSATTDLIAAAAASSGIYVAIGINEVNVEASGSSLYNTLLYFDDAGRIMGKHRKLIPTAAERLVWTPGDGSTLDTYHTPFGRVGGLICWENYMPLARYAMYAAGIEIYLAPTWDRGESWIPTLQHIAKEAAAYVVGCCMLLRQSDIPDSFVMKERFYQQTDQIINSGRSLIVDPTGRVVAGPVDGTEEILYATADLAKVQEARWMLDVAGHYARPDVFDLRVDRRTRPLVRESRPTDPGEPASTTGDLGLVPLTADGKGRA